MTNHVLCNFLEFLKRNKTKTRYFLFLVVLHGEGEICSNVLQNSFFVSPQLHKNYKPDFLKLNLDFHETVQQILPPSWLCSSVQLNMKGEFYNKKLKIFI